MEKIDHTHTLVLSNQVGELETIRSSLKNILLAWNIPPSLEFPLNLAMEEAFVNVISYAFTDQETHHIEVQFRMLGKQLEIILADDGKPFDPTLQQQPDIGLPAQERPVGGLGIFLVKKVMDQVEYRRSGNKNLLILTKNIAI